MICIFILFFYFIFGLKRCTNEPVVGFIHIKFKNKADEFIFFPKFFFIYRNDKERVKGSFGIFCYKSTTPFAIMAKGG